MSEEHAERRSSRGRRCPCIGVLCFLCAFLSSLFSSRNAAADGPPTALRSTPVATPAAILGVSNPYLLAAAAQTPEVTSFTFSRDLVDFARRVENLATFGVDLNQRKLTRFEKLNLRVRGRNGGGVLQLCYRH